MAQTFKSGHEIRDRAESNRSLAKFAASDDLGFQATFAFAERKPLANSDLAPGTHQTFPLKRSLKLLREKKLAAASKKILHRWIVRCEWLCLLSASVPEQSRRNHTSVIHDQQVVGTQKVGKLPESEIDVFARILLEVEHARGCPIG
jgi:hypothetical protein